MAHDIIGNQPVLDLLEDCLHMAREHGMQHVAISMVAYPNKAYFAASGEVPLEINQHESVTKLAERLQRNVDNGKPPPQDESLGAEYACYNAVNGSYGFDFISWLIDAEMRRIRLKAPAPLRVGFWCGWNQEIDSNRDKRGHWLEHVFRPALTLVGAVEDERAIYAHRSGTLTRKPITVSANKGESVPRLSAIYDRPVLDEIDAPVTITLREAGYWPHRNSDLQTWHRFAVKLKQAGERVIFIRDTAMAHEAVAGFETDPLASIDLIHRMRVYETAKCNLFVANGPCELALFSDRPWLCFTPIEDEDSGYRPNTPKFWEEDHGIKVHEQFPWSGPAQRIVWEYPTYDALCRAWDGIKEML
jgi:hypothetical protein